MQKEREDNVHRRQVKSDWGKGRGLMKWETGYKFVDVVDPEIKVVEFVARDQRYSSASSCEHTKFLLHRDIDRDDAS